MKCGIYKITNTKNSKFYIGSSVNLGVRKTRHFCDLRANRHDNSYLQNSYNKYGEESFVFEVLFTCPESDLIRIEQLFIDNYRPQYNLLPKAYTTLGYKHKESTIQKLKEIRKDLKPSPKASINSGLKTQKTVYQYDRSWNLVNTWNSTKAAGRALNIASTNIAFCCRKAQIGDFRVSGDYHWTYQPT